MHWVNFDPILVRSVSNNRGSKITHLSHQRFFLDLRRTRVKNSFRSLLSSKNVTKTIKKKA